MIRARVVAVFLLSAMLVAAFALYAGGWAGWGLGFVMAFLASWSLEPWMRGRRWGE